MLGCLNDSLQYYWSCHSSIMFFIQSFIISLICQMMNYLITQCHVFIAAVRNTLFTGWFFLLRKRRWLKLRDVNERARRSRNVTPRVSTNP